MLKLPTLLELLEAGVHFGHQTSKRYPKTKPYIFGIRSGIHIINLEKTVEKLKEALDFIKEISAKNGTILFLGTKKQAKDIVKKAALEVNMPYITERWLGGTFTNLDTIIKNIKKMKKMEEEKEKGEFKKYTKKEQLKFEKEIEKLKRLFDGLRELNKLPEAIFIIGINEEETAEKEAKKKNVPIVAIIDTNTKPQNVAYPIPANDDGIKSIKMMVNLVVEAIKEGKSVTKNEQSTNSSENLKANNEKV
ncbi:30S ribosomal protein S2 [Candidatus Kuenenbacteria bacterium HGW-Kuenenbacteria-1]|uniref:Small ribosomal subunit protein uS2 n=1 Tax=Candidatus Kuenenbacteria bacterium HGW-Kuenenbacteria-1 TaxID=2013812 RepID=A0A2N1UNZ8_9BACT|nr:MAG: 30S ribosomal protein S2 [Candidatus Kuenenbacteria bacterium HGW-Kuenenbacteria-1]